MDKLKEDLIWLIKRRFNIKIIERRFNKWVNYGMQYHHQQ